MAERNVLLIVDDLLSNRVLIGAIFKNEWEIVDVEDGQVALNYLKNNGDRVVAILLDLIMPNMDGYQFLEIFNKDPLFKKLPTIVITGDMSVASQNKGFSLGVADYIQKPFVASVIKHRVKNLVDLFNHKHNLELLVEKQSSKIREQSSKLITALSTLVEFRDLESGQHINRIKYYCKVLMTEWTKMHPESGFTSMDIDNISVASSLHDIGKIAIPDSILQKPESFTKEEYEIMKLHTVKGADIIKKINGNDTSDPFFEYGYNIALYHHERWDGRGYPNHLKGDEIPIYAQIVAIVDVYDALVAERCYKSAFSFEDANRMIVNGECGIFNPEVLLVFQKCRSQLEQIASSLMNK